MNERDAMVEWIRANPGGEFPALVAATAPPATESNQPLSQQEQIDSALRLAKSFRPRGVGQDCQGRLWWYEDNPDVDYFIEHDGIYPPHHPLTPLRKSGVFGILWEGFIVQDPLPVRCALEYQ